MYIIGTAGHIDHGKTSLIRALTGIDCDRLPEEKAREMTIDIGFAMIEYPGFGTVSIVDVPGHERFIRNMVAGAWGIDLGLLLVAADDGWMPQTEDHFQVLELLGIPRIVVALNKIDAVDADTRALAVEEIMERFGRSSYPDAELMPVSAKTGEGIPELKEAIGRNLRQLAKISDNARPYLYVDRAFTVRGHGTVVTGTLKNGNLAEGDTVSLLPRNIAARIKGIESHYNRESQGAPSRRTALNLADLPVQQVERGDIAVRENFFTGTRNLVAHIRITENGRTLRNNAQIELLPGTAKYKGTVMLFGEKQAGGEFYCRIRFDEPRHFFPGQRFVITLPGGYRIIGGGMVLVPDYADIRNRQRFSALMHSLATIGTGEIISLMLAGRECVRTADLVARFPDRPKNIGRLIDSLVASGTAQRIGDFVLYREFYDTALGAIAELIKRSLGLNMREIADQSEIDIDVIKLLVPVVIKSCPVIEKDGRFFAGSMVTEENLPADRQRLLAEVRGRGGEGIELERAEGPVREMLRELIRLGFLVTLDGAIVYHAAVYAEYRDRVLALFDGRDRISIADARDATGLSRKFLIPLLNKIEADGRIKRLGDFRIKV